MDFETTVLRITSYLKNQIPASRVDDITRKLAFLYYLNKKYDSGVDHKTVQGTANSASMAVVDVFSLSLRHKDICVGNSSRFPFKSGQELMVSILKCWEDYYNLLNGGYYPIPDTKTIHSMFYSLSEDELLEILNRPFPQSFREESTPTSVTKLVLKLAERYCGGRGRATDMTCGTGSFLLSASKQFDEVNGVELNEENKTIATIRLFVNRICGEIRYGDCFRDSWQHQTDENNRSDLVFSEFPWKIVFKNSVQKEMMFNCNANRFPLSFSSTTDYYFLSAMMNYLKKDGVAISVLPLSSLSNLSDRSVRKFIADTGYIREVIALPNNIFGRTSVATAIVVMGLQPVNKICLFDGSSFLKQETRTINSIDVDGLLYALDASKANGSCYFDKKDLEKHDYSFSPAHYLKKVEKTIPNATELSEIAEIFTGWQVSSAKLEMIHRTDGHGTKLLQMSNVEGGTIVSELKRYDIPDSTIERFMVRKGDVVISTKSLKVKAAVVDLSTDEPIVAAGSIMVVRPKPGVLDPYYLVAYFESDLGRQVLGMYQTGNVIPNLSIGNVKRIPVPKLKIAFQKDIGMKYKDLRDLILSEKQRLKSLEEKVNTILDTLWDSEEAN